MTLLPYKLYLYAFLTRQYFTTGSTSITAIRGEKHSKPRHEIGSWWGQIIVKQSQSLTFIISVVFKLVSRAANVFADNEECCDSVLYSVVGLCCLWGRQVAKRLVFTSDGVLVGVVIRRVQRYDLVKIKPTESEAEHRFCLCLPCLRSSENCIVEVASRSGRINQ